MRWWHIFFILFNSPEHLKHFQSYLNYCHVHIYSNIENEIDNRMPFFNVNTTTQQGKFTTSVFLKPTFTGIYNHFNSFSPSTYKFTWFIHCYIDISWFKLMDVFKSKDYSENIINNWFKIFLEKKHRVQKKWLLWALDTFVFSPFLPWTIIIANCNQVKKISERWS